MVQEYVKRQVNANRCSSRYLAVAVFAEPVNTVAGVRHSFRHLGDVEQFVYATGEPVQLHVDELNGYLYLKSADHVSLVRAAPGEVLVFNASVRRFTVESVAFFVSNYSLLKGLDGEEGG